MVAAMIAFAVVLLVANLYVQSQGAQQRIRQTLTEALRVPVTLEKTTLTPWEGLRLDGITLQPAAFSAAGEVPEAALLTADSFRLHAAWWPLLAHHRLEIDTVLLDHPRLVWAQNPEGRWAWPQDSPSPPPQAVFSSPAIPRALSGSAQESPAGGNAVAAVPGPSVPSSATRKSGMAAVEKFRVRHGALDLLNGQRKLLGRFEELDVDGRLAAAGRAEGQLRIQRAIHPRSGLNLTNFRSAFLYDEAAGLTIDNGKGEFAGGELQANYRLRTQEDGSPFSAECRVKGVELSELIREAGSQLRLMDGHLQGAVSVQGFSDDPERRQATGQLTLTGAEVRNFPVFQLLGELLHIEDLSHLQFKEAKLDCQLNGDNLRIAPLSLASNDLRIRAEGQYSTREDQIDLHGRLTIDQAISHQLPQFIEMNFTPSGAGAPGSRFIDFDVTGPLNKPTTNLFDRVVAGPGNGLLQNLLAPKPKKPRPKSAKTGEQPSPPATPGEPGNP